jgi:plastocyanin
MRRALAIATLLLACVLLACVLPACSSGGGSTPVYPNEVKVADFAFTPATLTVAVGQKVTWVFDQPDAPHNVYSTSGPTQLNSGTPQGNGTWAYTFTTPGTYHYICQVHPNMHGTIIVTQ